MEGKDVKKIREKTGMSQSVFAESYGINLFTLRQWERRDSELDSAVTAYMRCIKADHKIVGQLLANTLTKK